MLYAKATDRPFNKRNGALFIIVTIHSEITNLVIYALNYYNFHTNLTITYLLTPWSRVLLEKLTGSAASQEIPRIFGNPKIPQPYQQAPATCPYPEPTPSSPHNSLPLPEDPS